jgi:hypothetical protein
MKLVAQTINEVSSSDAPVANIDRGKLQGLAYRLIHGDSHTDCAPIFSLQVLSLQH